MSKIPGLPTEDELQQRVDRLAHENLRLRRENDRDHLAAIALNGLIAFQGHASLGSANLAKTAYEIADQMLKVRDASAHR